VTSYQAPDRAALTFLVGRELDASAGFLRGMGVEYGVLSNVRGISLYFVTGRVRGGAGSGGSSSIISVGLARFLPAEVVV